MLRLCRLEGGASILVPPGGADIVIRGTGLPSANAAGDGDANLPAGHLRVSPSSSTRCVVENFFAPGEVRLAIFKPQATEGADADNLRGILLSLVARNGPRFRSEVIDTRELMRAADARRCCLVFLVFLTHMHALREPTAVCSRRALASAALEFRGHLAPNYADYIFYRFCRGAPGHGKQRPESFSVRCRRAKI